MAALTLALFGPFQAMVDGRAVTAFPTDKVRALLAYLAVEAGRPHRRATLAALLWPEMDDEVALRNLRKTLHRLNQAVGPSRPPARQKLCLSTRLTLQINPAVCVVDISAFQALVDAADCHPHRHLHLCQPCLDRLTRAAALYQGEVLTGFSLANAPAFEEWLLMLRERALHQVLRILSRLAEARSQRGEYDQAYEAAARQVALDPYREEAHRQVMQALARNGQRSEALAYYGHCRQVLAESLGVEPEAETVALYEWIQRAKVSVKAEAGSGNAPHTAGPVPLHHVPPQFTPFIGRASELSRLQEHLLDPDCRLLTVLGAGGVGKTRLSIRAAEQLATQNRFADGIYFLSLAELTAAEMVPAALAACLELHLEGQRDPWQQVCDYLRQRQCLLVLDNFEPLLAGVHLLVELLGVAPRTRLLVTSRLPLELRAERRLLLEGLEYPGQRGDAGPETGESGLAAGGVTTRDAAGYGAVQLFVQAARQVRSAFDLSPEVVPAVVRICQLVHGVPLALEIAAVWVRLLDCAAIAAEIDRGISFLITPLRDVPARHRSMEAVFLHSWRLLSAREQAMLARLSVFRGPFDLETAESAIGATALDLAALVDTSLVQQVAGGWYEIHDLARQFAARELDTLGPDGESAREARQQHSDHYLLLVASQEPALYGPAPHQTAAALRRRLGNIRQAWHWAVEHTRLDTIGASLEGFGRLYELSGLFEEGERTLSRAADQLRQRLDTDAMPEPGVTRLMSRLLIWQAHFQDHRNRPDDAIRTGHAALTLARQYANAEGEALACSLLGQILPHRGEFAQAEEQLRHAVAHFRATDQQRHLATALSRMGTLQWRQGAYGQALEYLRQARVATQAVGDTLGLAKLGSSIAGVHYEQGDMEEALAQAHEAARLYQTIGDTRGCATMAGNLALVYRQLGRFDLALDCNGRDLDTSREFGDRHGIAIALGNRAALLALMGQFDQALTCYEQAMEIEEAAGNRWDSARYLAGIGAVRQQQGDNERALACYDQALPVLRAHGARYYVIGPLLDKAELAYRRGHAAAAEELTREVIGIATELGLPEYLLRGQVLAARIAYAAGERARAIGQLRALLAGARDRSAQAAIHYALWQLDLDEEHARAAIGLYRELYRQSPHYLYRTRLDELLAARSAPVRQRSS